MYMYVMYVGCEQVHKLQSEITTYEVDEIGLQKFHHLHVYIILQNALQQYDRGCLTDLYSNDEADWNEVVVENEERQNGVEKTH